MATPEVVARLQEEFPQQREAVAPCVELLEKEISPIFIARYEGGPLASLRERDVLRIDRRFQELEELERRRRSIFRILETIPGKLTPELKKQIEECKDLQTLEDVFAPVRPKKTEEVNDAIQKGLEPLAEKIETKALGGRALDDIAKEFLSEELGVKTVEEALAGARTILVQRFFDHPEYRKLLRKEMREKGTLVADGIEGKEEKAGKFKSYFGHKEALKSIPSHRMLALRRGEREKFVKLRIEIDDEAFQKELEKSVMEGMPDNDAAPALKGFLLDVIKEGYRRLRERCFADVKIEVKERADDQAIHIAQRNLRELLHSPPYGRRPVLGIDVGLRNLVQVFVDKEGKNEAPQTLPWGDDEKRIAFRDQLKQLLKEKPIRGVAVGGSGDARAVINVIRNIIRDDKIRLDAVLFSDSIGETYGGSPVGKEEYPELDKATRSALFIAKRFQDPLLEVVKVEPRMLGVGQYQHDVGKFRLNQALHRTVQSCVCHVGVNPNTASASLLKYVPGLNPEIATALVKDRNENGNFKTREDLKRVEAVTDEVFYSSSPFLRIRGGENPLDATEIHPKDYPLAEKIATAAGKPLSDLIRNRRAMSSINLKSLASDDASPEKLREIIDLLGWGGRDPRNRFRAVQFRKDIQSEKDLQAEMVMGGVVSNVTNFGAFVDIGLEQDGLVHISELADRFVRLPHEVVRVGQIVTVRVLSVDGDTGRVSLSMKIPEELIQKERERVKRENTVIVRAATHRRDGLVDFPKERENDRKDGKRKGRGDKRDRNKKGGNKRGAKRDQMNDFAKRDDRDERREDFQKRKRRGDSSRSKSNQEKADVVPQGEGFVNNPFKSFFKTQSEPTDKESSSKE